MNGSLFNYVSSELKCDFGRNYSYMIKIFVDVRKHQKKSLKSSKSCEKSVS